MTENPDLFSKNVSFPVWLRQCRKVLDLTQEALARRVGYSASTIRKLEQGTLQPSRELTKQLVRALDLPSEQIAPFTRYARRKAAASMVTTLPRHALKLPYPTTPLIGRDRLSRSDGALHDRTLRQLDHLV